MIRFCDKEVCCVLYDDLDREELLSWFFRGNMDEVVCVLNQDGTYRGRITYYSLINCDKAAEAVSYDCVELNEMIWENARKFFSGYVCRLHEYVMLPVVDREGNLVSFAYEDGEANREIRMIRELEERHGALSFADIYPQYACVKISGCNELAVLFAEYLRKHGIAVKTEGELWENFIQSDQQEWPDYQCLTIYAEGVEGNKSKNWVENLLRSVSPEFECVDCIYEANIKKGFVVNAIGDAVSLIDCLKKTDREIVILGTGIESQNTYDLLLSHGIECKFFVSNVFEERKRLLLGKEILSYLEMRNRNGKVVMLDCESKNSAWGTGLLDYYDYLGFHRNKDLFVVKDYLEIPHNNLRTALSHHKLLFVGDVLLCERAAGYLVKNTEVKEILYADVLGDNIAEVYESRIMKQIRLEEADKDMLCLVVVPDYNVSDEEVIFDEKKKKILCCLKEKGLLNYTDYFSHTQSFIAIEKDVLITDGEEQYKPKKFILGALDGSNGNIFMKGLLDNHPSVLMISDFNFFNNNLFWFCVRLANLSTEKMPYMFEKICQSESGTELKDEEEFIRKMTTLLEPGKRYASQEIFVILLLSYVFMYGRDIEDVRDMVIYWEPHHMGSSRIEELTEWLEVDSPCGILNVVRNLCMVKGSMVKGMFTLGLGKKENSLLNTLTCPDIEKKRYAGCERYVFRFEDVKTNPRKELSRLCEEWEIPWSDTLMETTKYGKRAEYNDGHGVISDFDLKPVYNSYEEYFSEFDRFRISLICAPWQRKYGYPFVEMSDFSRRELQEMFLKRFRFESEITYNGVKGEQDHRIWIQNQIRSLLWEVRKAEFLEDQIS